MKLDRADRQVARYCAEHGYYAVRLSVDMRGIADTAEALHERESLVERDVRCILEQMLLCAYDVVIFVNYKLLTEYIGAIFYKYSALFEYRGDFL